MIRLILADDSATARELLRSIFEQDSTLQVVGEARDGEEAVRLVSELKPDVIIMDVHMPIVDGITATKRIMARRPTPILIVSAATQQDVDLSLTATQAGALMAMAKPEGPSSPRFQEAAAELREMAKAMSQVKVVRSHLYSPEERPPPARRGVPRTVELVAMAASTGGPAALREVLRALPSSFPAPILVVQHMARHFTAGFVEWLDAGCPLRVKLAEDNEVPLPGAVYVAPDDRHLGVMANGRIALLDTPPIGGFRPSASHLFASAGAVHGHRLVAVVMTGMGVDGAAALVAAHDAGAYVIAQDAASAVVHGMAQEAVRLGAVDTELPLVQIAPHLIDTVGRAARVS